MSAIRYGNLSVELVSRHGARLTRMTTRQDPVDLFRPRHPRALPPSRIIGREPEVAEALRAIGPGRPIEFHASCGYGRTTLLQQIAASAAERYRGSGCVYLRADGDRVDDVVQHLVTELYDTEPSVKLTPAECTRLLSQAGAIVVLDDAPVDPDKAGYLLDVLPGCSVVLGCASRVPVRGGSSHQLPGLPADAALALLAAELGRPLAAQEVRLARNLAAAVDGQPLRLKQAAALLREGSHSIAALAWQAASDPAALDRLSVSVLTGPERRALAVLAFTAGVLLPPDVVSVIGQTARLAECLTSLRRKGLAEERRDRFGLPVCQAESYRATLLGELQLGASAGALCDWLANRDPSASDSQSAASAALAMIEFMAQRRDWMSVVQLARTTEQILFIAGRWEAWHHVLNHGLIAAKASQAVSAEAFFAHQLGCLELCLDRLDDAARLLRHALALREQYGDHTGAQLTRQNLQLLEPASLPARPRRPHRHRITVTLVLTTVLSGLGVVASAMAIAAALRGGPGPAPATIGPSSATSSASSSAPASPSSSAPVTPVASTTPVTPITSIAPVTVTVPEVRGQTQDQAASALGGAGLIPAPTTVTHCTAANDNIVVSENPGGGTQVGKNTDVSIGVCHPSPPAVLMPNVLGLTLDAATASLQSLGLTVSDTQTSDCTASQSGFVVTQDPLAGTAVTQGSPATIGVCDATSSPGPVR